MMPKDKNKWEEYRLKISSTSKGRNLGGTSHMKGKHHTEETKLKISLKKKGVKLSDECKKKMSFNRTGCKHWNYGNHWNKETRQQMSISHIGQKAWNAGKEYLAIKGDKNPSKRPEVRIKLSDKRRQYMISNNYNFRVTQPEIKIKTLLESLQLGHQFRNHIVNINHKYIADFYLEKYNLIIEVDGNYWHHYPVGTDKDKIRTAEMIDAGYNILRFWESDINNDIEKIKEVILCKIQELG
jgi:very-short-patch-repair endonuclease